MCKQYLWETLKDRPHVNNPHSLHELMDPTQEKLPVFQETADIW